MNVWLCIPSKRENGGTAPLWKAKGYHVALFRDPGEEHVECADLVISGPYQGYGHAINTLVREVIARDPEAMWMVSGGDDTEPDERDPQEIGRECSNHFYGAVEMTYPPSRPEWASIPLPSPGGSGEDAPSWKRWSTFGVMQPTGDGHGIEHICGSPWLGREFCQRMYQGNGPYWEEYRHQWDDNEVQEVAIRLGVLWQRHDLRHKHNHFSWTGQPMPEFLKWANTSEHFEKNRRLFQRRLAENFPGHQPLGAESAIIIVDVTKHHDTSDNRRYEFS